MNWEQFRAVLTNDFNLNIEKGSNGSTWILEMYSYGDDDDMILALDDDDLVLPSVIAKICETFRIAPAALIACLPKQS